jgi:hypothetical protein
VRSPAAVHALRGCITRNRGSDSPAGTYVQTRASAAGLPCASRAGTSAIATSIPAGFRCSAKGRVPAPRTYRVKKFATAQPHALATASCTSAPVYPAAPPRRL